MARGRRVKLTRELADWAEELPASFTACRDMGHNWVPYSARWDSKERVYVRTLVCTRCTCERSQEISQTGHIMHGNAYRYPEGYAAPAGVGHIDGAARDGLRLMSTLRMVDETAAHEEGA